MSSQVARGGMNMIEAWRVLESYDCLDIAIRRRSGKKVYSILVNGGEFFKHEAPTLLESVMRLRGLIVDKET